MHAFIVHASAQYQYPNYTLDAIKCHSPVVSQKGIHGLKTQRGKWRDRTSGRATRVPDSKHMQPLLAPAWL